MPRRGLARSRSGRSSIGHGPGRGWRDWSPRGNHVDWSRGSSTTRRWSDPPGRVTPVVRPRHRSAPGLRRLPAPATRAVVAGAGLMAATTHEPATTRMAASTSPRARGRRWEMEPARAIMSMRPLVVVSEGDPLGRLPRDLRPSAAFRDTGSATGSRCAGRRRRRAQRRWRCGWRRGRAGHHPWSR